MAGSRREACSSVCVGRGWATVCGFGCSAAALQATVPCGAQARGPVAELATRTGARCAQTTATSQSTKRAARAGHELCAPRHCIGAAAGGPPAARRTLVLHTERQTRNVVAARVFGRCAQHRRCQPRMVGERIREVKEEPERQLGRGTGADSLTRRPRPARHKTKGCCAPEAESDPLRWYPRPPKLAGPTSPRSSARRRPRG